MLDKLVEEKNRFVGKFTEEGYAGIDSFICSEMESEYSQWLARLATYAERNLKKEYPEMTTIVLSKVKNQSTTKKDFDMISGYLDAVKEEVDEAKVFNDEILALNDI